MTSAAPTFSVDRSKGYPLVEITQIYPSGKVCTMTLAPYGLSKMLEFLHQKNLIQTVVSPKELL